jgi:hypothetical protein
LMLPNTMLPMLTEHVCAKEAEESASNAVIAQVGSLILRKQR